MVLITVVQQNDSVLYIHYLHSFLTFSIMVYYRGLIFNLEPRMALQRTQYPVLLCFRIFWGSIKGAFFEGHGRWGQNCLLFYSRKETLGAGNGWQADGACVNHGSYRMLHGFHFSPTPREVLSQYWLSSLIELSRKRTKSRRNLPTGDKIQGPFPILNPLLNLFSKGKLSL